MGIVVFACQIEGAIKVKIPVQVAISVRAVGSLPIKVPVQVPYQG